MSNPLPPEEEIRIIDVQLRHVVAGLVLLSVTALGGAGALLVLRDYLRLRRQQHLLHALTRLVIHFNPSGVSHEPKN